MVVSVTEFISTINAALAPLEEWTVQGEVDEYKIAQGKWVVFKLRDTESSVGCFLPVWRLRTAIEEGMLVQVRGRPKLRNKGFFSLDVDWIQPAGEGALKRAFALLQERLTQEGLFAQERKRPLPRFPQHIVLITSREAAAYSDFLKVIQARMGGLHISFIHTQVQGEAAVQQIVDALSYANTHVASPDVIVLVRGGGSLEDLQAFNDELVVRAVAGSRTPTIVGIGHERDVSLAELAADVRASTPSNAAELLVASRQELLTQLTTFSQALQHRYKSSISDHLRRLVTLTHDLQHRVATTEQQVMDRVSRLERHYERWQQQIAQRFRDVERYRHGLIVHGQQRMVTARQRLSQLERLLQSWSPQRPLQRGYTITRTDSGVILRHLDQARPGLRLHTQLVDGELVSTVEEG